MQNGFFSAAWFEMLIFTLLSSSLSVAFKRLSSSSRAIIFSIFLFYSSTLLSPATTSLSLLCSALLLLSFLFLSLFLPVSPLLWPFLLFACLAQPFFLSPEALVTAPLSHHCRIFWLFRLYMFQLRSLILSVCQAHYLHMGQERWRAPLTGQTWWCCPAFLDAQQIR